MKKQAINCSWPASLSDFSVDTNQGNFSRCKLNIFYKGETADHRLFSDSFAESLVPSIPYTPVVGRFNEEKDDFEGHASEQNIYGIVDPMVEPTFETFDDGNQWCVCDVVLYTERPDQVGEIAKKIEGHKQSLELDPRSVKYKINYDERKHFKSIEFTAGTIVGVSVLGNDQKPAFTGSEFFSVDADFEAKMKILRDYCESKKDQKQSGGEEMNLNEFIKLSWGDISLKVYEAVCKEYEADAYVSFVDMYDDSCICRFWYYIDGSCKLMRVGYTFNAETSEVNLTKINEVVITYTDVEEGVSFTADSENKDIEQAPEQGADASETEASGTNVEGEVLESNDSNNFNSSDAIEGTVVEEASETSAEQSNVQENTDGSANSNFNESESSAQDENVNNITPNESKVSVENEQESNNQENSGSTSFTESERAEFEALKREEKISLVNSYKDDLPEELISDFLAKVDSFEKADLEVELLKAYKANVKQTKQMRAFAFAPVQNNASNDSLDSFVRNYLGK